MRAIQYFSVLSLIGLLSNAPAASADTLRDALVRAYQNNPQLNAQRALVRATDETVPQALSGYRPRINVSGSAGVQYSDILTNDGTLQQPFYTETAGTNGTRSIGATVTQSLFNGYQTANRTRGAEAQVSSAREGLRVLEQSVLLASATVYMDYLRDSAIALVLGNNVRVLQKMLLQTTDRANVGEITMTDVALSKAQLAAGQTQQLAAESTLVTTRANFRRIIGDDPKNLAPGTTVDRWLPSTLQKTVEQALLQNPNITAAMYGVDVTFLNVKISEGALFPTAALVGSVSQSYETSPTLLRSFGASAVAQLSIPVYQGGSEYSLIRQSKETLTQQRFNLEQVRDQTRATAQQAWAQLQAAIAQISAAQAQVAASERALSGIRDEAQVGERTTLDVLNGQQALVNARVSLLTAQHDRVIASYAVLSAIGGLSAEALGLNTNIYDPVQHYQQIRDAWAGVRISDGR